MYPVLRVAACIIELSNKYGCMVSNLKLQKLLYYVQAQFLVNYEEPCFPESIEAWDIGPVVPAAYRKYAKYGGASIFRADKEDIGYISPEDLAKIWSVVVSCADYTVAELTKITQQETPWKKAYSPHKVNTISNESILAFVDEW